MQLKKHILPFLLVLVLTLPVFTILIISGNQRDAIRKEIKHRMIEGIDKSELVLLKFKKSEVDDQVRWKHSKEFEYRNSMYDIVDVEEKGEMIYYWCWWDHKETRLNKNLHASLNAYLNANKEEQNKKTMFSHFFKNLFNQAPNKVAILNDSRSLKFPPLVISYSSKELPVQNPPPKQG